MLVWWQGELRLYCQSSMHGIVLIHHQILIATLFRRSMFISGENCYCSWDWKRYFTFSSLLNQLDVQPDFIHFSLIFKFYWKHDCTIIMNKKLAAQWHPYLMGTTIQPLNCGPNKRSIIFLFEKVTDLINPENSTNDRVLKSWTAIFFIDLPHLYDHWRLLIWWKQAQSSKLTTKKSKLIIF